MSDKNKECEFCRYGWKPRVDDPISCPRCKRRFDYKEARIVLQKLGKEFGYEIGGAL